MLETENHEFHESHEWQVIPNKTSSKFVKFVKFVVQNLFPKAQSFRPHQDFTDACIPQKKF